MEAFWTSTLIVALAEVGDKTQLLALILSARFAKPVPIIAGIFVATLVNHAVAAALGQWVHSLLTPDALRWLLGVSFLAVAAWAIVPDKLDEDAPAASHLGVFVVALIAFFLAEIGDKTQIATVMLAARFDALASVVAGTTLGMMLANVPAVLLGQAATRRMPIRTMRLIAAALFAALGVATLAGVKMG